MAIMRRGGDNLVVFEGSDFAFSRDFVIRPKRDGAGMNLATGKTGCGQGGDLFKETA